MRLLTPAEKWADPVSRVTSTLSEPLKVKDTIPAPLLADLFRTAFIDPEKFPVNDPVNDVAVMLPSSTTLPVTAAVLTPISGMMVLSSFRMYTSPSAVLMAISPVCREAVVGTLPATEDRLSLNV